MAASTPSAVQAPRDASPSPLAASDKTSRRLALTPAADAAPQDAEQGLSFTFNDNRVTTNSSKWILEVFATVFIIVWAALISFAGALRPPAEPSAEAVKAVVEEDLELAPLPTSRTSEASLSSPCKVFHIGTPEKEKMSPRPSTDVPCASEANVVGHGSLTPVSIAECASVPSAEKLRPPALQLGAVATPQRRRPRAAARPSSARSSRPSTPQRRRSLPDATSTRLRDGVKQAPPSRPSSARRSLDSAIRGRLHEADPFAIPVGRLTVASKAPSPPRGSGANLVQPRWR